MTPAATKAKRALGRVARRTIRDAGPLAGASIFRGDNVECPCCGRSYRRFRDLHGANRQCWECGALERHRSAALLFAERPEMLQPGMRMLHVAPEPSLARVLDRVPGLTRVTGDLNAEYGELPIDVTDLSQFATGSFDAVICNHVLEHVPDDRRAMAELRRVLKPGGWTMLLVPDVETQDTYEDPSVVDPAERIAHFGQHDHVRRYGWDYVDRLTDAGFDVTVNRPEELFNSVVLGRSRIRKFGLCEPLFVAS